MSEEQPAAVVPYQAYKSKRQTHSRNVSLSRLTPPPIPATYDSREKTPPAILLPPSSPTSNGLPSPPESPNPLDTPDQADAEPSTSASSPTASSSGSPSHSAKVLLPKKPSSFRHVPRTRPSVVSSPLAVSAANPRHCISPMDTLRIDSKSRVSSPSPLSQSNPAHNLATPHPNNLQSQSQHNNLETPQPRHPSIPTRTSSLHASPTTSPAPQLPSTSTPPFSRSPAPYRPGFQPRGVINPRTDEFILMRKQARDGVESSARIERTKLERRLEKLINLHFPLPGKKEQNNAQPRPPGNRRASSFFDIDLRDLKRMSIPDTSSLWKGVLTATAGKNDMRFSEQRITPWEEDASVSKCPMCSTSFHPLTNRKHHCRLCGKIVCSLPIKHPQRPALCSILFVVDPTTRKIEEVGEGVDYGVKRKRTTSISGPPAPGNSPLLQDDDKFLRGVRICRNCRPILLRQQYQQESSAAPTFSHLYELLLELEKELEDSLPQFQEMLLSLNQDDHPTKEAAAARKRLLEVFAKYDAVAKRIQKLPCAPNSSQDRVQMAVVTRANVFLQKHMFPLQSLPKPKAKHKKSSSKAAIAGTDEAPIIDPDSEMALALQPLLEQEALLESFVEEANTSRKFEDAKTLRTNLLEIRAEIERIIANADDGAVSNKNKTR